jgi:hypothetical protein
MYKFTVSSGGCSSELMAASHKSAAMCFARKNKNVGSIISVECNIHPDAELIYFSTDAILEESKLKVV